LLLFDLANFVKLKTKIQKEKNMATAASGSAGSLPASSIGNNDTGKSPFLQQQPKFTLDEAIEIHKQTLTTIGREGENGDSSRMFRMITFLLVIFLFLASLSWIFPSKEDDFFDFDKENEIFNLDQMKKFSAVIVCFIAALWMTVKKRLADVKISFGSSGITAEEKLKSKSLTPKQLQLIGADRNENVDLYLNSLKPKVSSSSNATAPLSSPFKKLPVPFTPTPNFNNIGTPQQASTNSGTGLGFSLASASQSTKLGSSSTPVGGISTGAVAITPQSSQRGVGVTGTTPSGLLGKVTSDPNVYSSPNSLVLVQPSPKEQQATGTPSALASGGGNGVQPTKFSQAQQRLSLTGQGTTPSSTTGNKDITNSKLMTLVNSSGFGGGTPIMGSTPGGTPSTSNAAGGTGISTAAPTIIHCDEDAAYNIVQSLKSPNDKRNGEALMEEWVGNLKRALRQYIAEEVLRPLDDIHQKLLREKDFPLPNSSTFTLASLEWEDSRQEPDEMYARYRFAETSPYVSNLLKQRKSLERFVCVRRHADMVHFPKNYVLKRLRTLVSSGENLSGYNWCGGEAFEGKSWSPERLPTDAEILFRIVCVWLDNLLKRNDNDPSFSSYYVKDVDRVDVDELRNQEWVGFLNCGQFVTPQTSSSATGVSRGGKGMIGSPAMSSLLDFNSTYYSGGSTKQFWPHFKFVKRGEIQEVRARRLNLFHCVVLFCYWLREDNIARVQDILSKVFAKQSSHE
jgi:hypothetical protein